MIQTNRYGKLKKQPNVVEAILYEKISSNKVRCGVCERKCTISNGEQGFCRTRTNIDGKLHTIVYGDLSSISLNPIEKKPFFHFWPGSYALTIGSWSCNFSCPWCQNFEISKVEPKPLEPGYVSPRDLVQMILREDGNGISVSFNEPTMLLEYALDVFPLARREGLYNNYVSNGYMTVEALRLLKHAGMDAIKFDVKGNEEVVGKYCGAYVDIVWRNIREAKRLGMHVEVVNLVIPGVNDGDECFQEISQRHLKELGPDFPLHFTQFYPTYKMTDRSRTPVEVLEKAYNIATKEGINYVYIGNVPGHRFENTYCSGCGKLLIQRFGFEVTKYVVTEEKKCPFCGLRIPIVGEYLKT